MDVVFTIDKKYIKPCAVTMLSILKNSVRSHVTFHIVGLNLYKNDIALLISLGKSYNSKVRFYRVRDEKITDYEIRWEKRRLSKVVFLRCMLASILPESISKVLFLDCDLLVLTPLDELWETDLVDTPLAAVPDNIVVNNKHCERLDYDNSYNYFNGGVLLLNLNYWRINNVEKLCLEYYNENPSKIIYNDQDLLNALFYDSKKLLDIRWNVQESAYRLPKEKSKNWHPPYMKLLLSPSILHFSGRKPWQYHCMHPLRNLYFEYESLLPIENNNMEWFINMRRLIHFMPYILGLKKNKYIRL